MKVSIDKIDVNEYIYKHQRCVTITIRRAILRMILEDYFQDGYCKEFQVEVSKGRYYLWIINTDLHRYWSEIPDDTIAFIVLSYYTLLYPNERMLFRKIGANYIITLKNIPEPDIKL